MEGNLKKLSTEEIEMKISALEDTYAVCFHNDEDAQQLSLIWKQIQELQKELKERKTGID